MNDTKKIKDAVEQERQRILQIVRDYIELGYSNGEPVNLLEDLLNDI